MKGHKKRHKNQVFANYDNKDNRHWRSSIVGKILVLRRKTGIFELAGRGIAVKSEREQNTFEHLHAIISIRIAMREIDKLKHIDSFHDFFHRSGDIVRIDRIFINKIQRELKRWLNCVTIY